MTARGRVTRVEKNKVTVEVVRESACAGDCASCHGCSGQTAAVSAFCDLDVAVGSVVELSSSTGYVHAFMFILFLLPVILPVFGYIAFAGLGGTVAVLAAVLLFAASAALILFVSRSKRCIRLITPTVINILHK